MVQIAGLYIQYNAKTYIDRADINHFFVSYLKYLKVRGYLWQFQSDMFNAMSNFPYIRHTKL